jgi:hypothetical protein
MPQDVLHVMPCCCISALQSFPEFRVCKPASTRNEPGSILPQIFAAMAGKH